jgi:hypothetical protein
MPAGSWVEDDDAVLHRIEYPNQRVREDGPGVNELAGTVPGSSEGVEVASGERKQPDVLADSISHRDRLEADERDRRDVAELVLGGAQLRSDVRRACDRRLLPPEHATWENNREEAGNGHRRDCHLHRPSAVLNGSAKGISQCSMLNVQCSPAHRELSIAH